MILGSQVIESKQHALTRQQLYFTFIQTVLENEVVFRCPAQNST